MAIGEGRAKRADATWSGLRCGRTCEEGRYAMKRYVVAIAVTLALLACCGCGGSSAEDSGIQPPMSASAVVGKNYQDVVTQFEKAGFTAVETEGLGDLVVGFLHGEGEVEEVSIDGDTSYKADARFEADAKVVIRYHSYPGQTGADAASSGNAEEEPSASKSQPPAESSSTGESGTASEKSDSLADCVGKTAAQAHEIATGMNLNGYYYDRDGKELTDIFESENKKAPVWNAVVTKAEKHEGLFGSEYAEFTLKYSAKKKVQAAEGKTAAQAAAIARNNCYEAEFLDKSGDDITDEVTGSSKVKAARSALVTQVELRSSWGDIATFTLDYGVPKAYKTALRKAQSYVDNMHMSKAALYDQLTSEYGEQYDAEAAQYAVDNVVADWKENALEMAKSYQENLDMSPAAIYDQLVSEYGERFTPEEAQYAIDHL